MRFIQNDKDGACDIIFSDKEIEIIKNKKKLVLPAETLRHFGNTLVGMVANWNMRFNEELQNKQTFTNTKIEGTSDIEDKK